MVQSSTCQIERRCGSFSSFSVSAWNDTCRETLSLFHKVVLHGHLLNPVRRQFQDYRNRASRAAKLRIRTFNMRVRSRENCSLLSLQHDISVPPLQLKVFLPASENTAARIEVPDTFYKLSPSEVRAEAAARKKALENSQLLIPKSFREKQAQQARDNFKAAMIRVQFPDGMVLQGVFSPMEPTFAVYEVSGARIGPVFVAILCERPEDDGAHDADRDTKEQSLR